MNEAIVTDCCFLSIPREGFRLVWEVTQHCPYSCEYCFTWSSPNRRRWEVEINAVIPKLDRLIDVLGVKDVLVTGGEPLAVWGDIKPFLRHVKEKGISFAVSSNVPDETVIPSLSSLEPRILNISIDPPSPDSSRSAFKSAYGKIKAKLKTLEQSGLRVKTTAVVSNANYESIAALLQVLTDILSDHKNIEKVAFNREYPVGFAAGSEPITKSQLSKAYREIQDWAGTLNVPVSLVNWSEFHAPLQSCPAGSRLVSIQQNGDVTPCSLLYNLTRSFRAGNLLTDAAEVIAQRLVGFHEALEEYCSRTEENTAKCSACQFKTSCGGGCLAMLPIASNHVPQRTCELYTERVADHERLLLSTFHRAYHEGYSPNPRKFATPGADLPEEIEDTIRDYVEKNLKPTDLAHTMEHINCVVKLAKYISRQEGASSKITVPAAYMHDIAPREPSMHHMHTFKSAVWAGEFLADVGHFTPEEILHIQYCIYTSSYGSYLLGYEPLSLEAKVVRDADWLDAIGARGIARVFAFEQAHGAKEVGYPDFDPEELAIPLNMNITGPDETPIYHFFSKLLRIAEMLQTPAGKRLGRSRHQLMVDFVRQYKEEMDLYDNGLFQLPLKLGSSNGSPEG